MDIGVCIVFFVSIHIVGAIAAFVAGNTAVVHTRKVTGNLKLKKKRIM